MADHDTEDDTTTPLMTKEDVYRAFVNKIDFWDDMPVLIRVMSEKFANRSPRIEDEAFVEEKGR